MKLFDLMYAGRSLGFTASAIGSTTLAAIFYQTSLGDFVYKTDSSGNAILDNQGPIGELHDGLPYSGRGIELGALNDVDIPIHHTLGSETVQQGDFSTDTVWIKGTGWTVDTVGGTASSDGTQTATSPLYQTTFVPTIGLTYLIEFDIVSIGAGGIYGAIGGADGALKTTIGRYSESVTAVTTTAMRIYANSTFVGTIDNVTIKQITNPNSYLTYYDFTDGLVTLGNSVDGGSSDNILNKDVTSTFGAGGVAPNVYTFDGVDTFTIHNEVLTPNTYTPQLILFNSNYILGDLYEVEITLTVTRGECLISGVDTQFSKFQSLVGIKGIGTYTHKAIDGFRISGGNRIGINFDGLNYPDFDCTVIMKTKRILPISTKYTLNTKTVNNVLKHATNWSPTARAKVENNPNLIGKLALETLGATKTIPELDMVMDAGASADSYYMCSEKSGAYLVDSRVAYGAEEVDSGVDYVNWDALSDVGVTTTADGITLTADGASFIDAKLALALSPSSYYVYSFTISANNLTTIAFPIRGTDIFESSVSVPAGTTGIFYGILKTQTTISVNNLHAYISSGEVLGNLITIKDYTLRKATATEIANYASTVRTNADLQQKGIQQTAFVTDGAGVPTVYSSNLLQFNSDGRYVDTGWIPKDADTYTVEFVTEFNSYISGVYSYHGCPSGQSPSIWYREGIQWLGSTHRMYSPTLTAGNIYHFTVIVINGVPTKMYTNGIDNGVQTTWATGGEATSSFVLGKQNGAISEFSDDNFGIFKVHKNKVLTSTEVSTAYAQAKAIYPTLP